mmetsp:Transcript_29236/g.58099  ORF Transcript_29236/g.58099 Transcript_29236/m.58099 type:complete len:360 (+) Transcript_29236:31-1110(+)
MRLPPPRLPLFLGFLSLILLFVLHSSEAAAGSPAFLSDRRLPLPQVSTFAAAKAKGGTVPLAAEPTERSQGLGKYRPLSIAPGKRTVLAVDLLEGGDAYVPFCDGWDLQGRIHAAQIGRAGARDAAARREEEPGRAAADQWYDDGIPGGAEATGCDAVIFLQHAPVYTLGTGSDEKYVLDAAGAAGGGPEVVRTDRGGEVTYHGPGQLTVYPLLDLRGYELDMHWYVRALEECVLRALDAAGVDGAGREDGVTGVWVNGRKVAAVGVKCRRWCTAHGMAVNVDRRSLDNFGGIVPCGLEGREVGCVEDLVERSVSLHEFAGYMRNAIEEVFRLVLVEGGTPERTSVNRRGKEKRLGQNK